MWKNLSPRTRAMYRITLLGASVNVGLMAAKLIVGILGNSVALVADAIHSLSDFLTDVVMLACVGLAQKPKDKNHDYGHGKYESIAAIVTAAVLIGVSVMLFVGGAKKAYAIWTGSLIPEPPIPLAMIIVLLSIVAKEWLFRITLKKGKELNSDAVLANAWDHRSDAYSSLATLIGVSGAYFLGSHWIVLDPLVCCVVSIFIFRAGIQIIVKPLEELTEKSLPDEVEKEIISIVLLEPTISNPHNLRTRGLGNGVAIEVDVCLPNETTVQEAHEATIRIEDRLYERFGQSSHVVIHIEPLHGVAHDHD